jgi:hypothetical protein
MTSRQFTPPGNAAQWERSRCPEIVPDLPLLMSSPSHISAQRSYNGFVAAPAPSNIEPTKPADDRHRHQHTAYAAEASGLLVIALLLLILVVIRYWQYIPWSAR